MTTVVGRHRAVPAPLSQRYAAHPAAGRVVDGHVRETGLLVAAAAGVMRETPETACVVCTPFDTGQPA